MAPFSRRTTLAAAGNRSFEVGSGHPIGTITHGDQVTSSNVGYGSWYDDSLGRALQLSDMAVISGTHYLSDFYSPGDLVYAVNFTGDIVVDVPNLTIRGCNFVSPVGGYLAGNHTIGWTVEYSTIDVSPVIGPNGLQYESYTARRCYIAGCTDGGKVQGGVGGTLVEECYIRVKSSDPQDHNDGLQNAGGSGDVMIRRCNIDGRSVSGIGGTNAAIFSADFPTNGTFTVQDNLLAGGTYTLGLCDGTIGSNFIYVATGNKIVRNSYSVLPARRDNTVNQNITWSNNTFSDNAEVIPLP